jgi:hypothetical protein
MTTKRVLFNESILSTPLKATVPIQTANCISEEVIDFAKNNNTSLNAAAKTQAVKYNLSPEAIRNAARRYLKNKGKKHGNQKFTNDEERAIAAVADAQSLIGLPLGRLEMMGIVMQVHPDLHGKDIRTWFSGFVKRWKLVLSHTPAKATTSERIAGSTIQDAKRWIAQYQSFMKKYKLSEKAVVIVDETRLRLDNPLSHEKVLNTRRRQKKAVNEHRGGKYSSYIPFICATGELVLHVFVVPFTSGKGANFPLLMQPDHPKKGSAPIYWAFTESGFVNTKLWFCIMKKFSEVWFKIHPRLELIISTVMQMQRFLNGALNPMCTRSFFPHIQHNGPTLWIKKYLLNSNMKLGQ